MCRPEIARAITRRWISLVHSMIVKVVRRCLRVVLQCADVHLRVHCILLMMRVPPSCREKVGMEPPAAWA